MEIFTLPLLSLTVAQTLVALLLLCPQPVSLRVALVIRRAGRTVAINSVLLTLAAVLAGLLVSCCIELSRGYDRSMQRDVRELVPAIDFLRGQVSACLCVLNLLLLFLARALAEALCRVDYSHKNLEAMQRQVKGLQAEYARATATPTPSPAAAGAGGAPSQSGQGSLDSQAGAEAGVLKKQLDKAIADKMALQVAREAAEKAQQSAEASVAAMKSQLKGFDKEYDRVLEENAFLKRRLAGAGDAKYAAELHRNVNAMLGTNTWLQGEGVLISPETCFPTLGRRARRLQPSLAPIKERPARKQWKRCRPGDTSWALAAYSGKLVPPHSTLHGPVHIVRAASNSPEVELPVNGGSSGALTKSDFPKFVQFFRQASPYIAGHRARTFVIVIPGNVTSNRTLLQSVMSDIALLHGLGVRVVVVVGIQSQIDALLLERSFTPAYVGGYRVTDRDALRVAVEAAGQVRTMCEQILSKGPAIPMIRRHTKGEREIHFEPALRVVSGNYVTAKRRGVIDGVDFGYTGDVRFVLRDDIHHQLDGGNVVLLSNLGFTAAGEVLNCNTFDVGLHAAAEQLGADKLFCYHLDEVAALQLPPWLPLSDAQDMLLLKLQAAVEATPQGAWEGFPALLLLLPQVALPSCHPGAHQPSHLPGLPPPPPGTSRSTRLQPGPAAWATRLASHKAEELVMDLDVWAASGYPPAVATLRLLQPLEDAGVLVKRSRDEVANMLQDFTVLERENKVMGCALLLHLGPDSEGNIVAELGAFCVDSAFRGSGRGDSLLDYVEQDARQQGVQRLVLLTTRTADWFEQRDFRWIGPAYANEVLPAARRARVNPTRNSQLYVKQLEAPHDNLQEPGKRIGY
ncbi:hypothetical protein QJQ45_018455 [Haematococcus lacustris]|nr:hypothetical protein QJQ45_018455 [Haematococcus lacustris]